MLTNVLSMYAQDEGDCVDIYKLIEIIPPVWLIVWLISWVWVYVRFIKNRSNTQKGKKFLLWGLAGLITALLAFVLVLISLFILSLFFGIKVPT